MKKNEHKKTSIVVIGGGTGTSTLLTGLKELEADLTAIVSVADSGGSTGKLRDEFGFQPVGDLRQSLAALAREGSQDWIRDLLLYRFSKGEGLKGHNLGNLILTALQDMAGSTSTALEISEKIFRLRGKIYPVTTENVQLHMTFSDGTTGEGEDLLNNPFPDGKVVTSVSLKPSAQLYAKARKALLAADKIVIGPGDYFASVMAALLVEGMKETLQETKAKLIYIVNLMTRRNQTHDMSALDHVKGVEAYLGRAFDTVIVNNGVISDELLKAYAKEEEYPVKNDVAGKHVIAKNLLAKEAVQQHPEDALHRSLVRHDPHVLAETVMEA